MKGGDEMLKELNAVRYLSSEKGMLFEQRKSFEEGSAEYMKLTKKIISLNTQVDNFILAIKKEHTAGTVSSES